MTVAITIRIFANLDYCGLRNTVRHYSRLVWNITPVYLVHNLYGKLCKIRPDHNLFTLI